RPRQLLPLAAALFSGLWACSDAGTSAAPATASTSVVPAPHVDDPVADWELQYLPAIDAHMKAGQLDSVITVCQLGIDGDSTRIVLYNLMASAYAGQGLYGAAAQALETAVRLSPDFTVGWANLGGMYARLGRHDEALPYLQRAADLDADNAAARRRLAESLLATHQYIRAAAEIRATLALLPDDATLTLLLGESQQGLGQTTDALASFLRAGALDPGFDAAHTHAAEAARQLGQQVVADSCQFLQEHLQQIAAGDTAALTTKTRLRDAVTNAPEEPIHQARLGGFYLYHKYLPEALALFHRASRLRPNDLWLINEFGGLLSRTGNGDEALGFYLQALQVNPDYGPALINAGGILNALQRHEEALRHFEHALTLSPEDPGIRFFLGVTYISLERYDDARTQLQQALASLDDSDEAARLQPQIEAALEALPR
ncbi:MAG: tetratricopeptide repeat protein, partial [bacterium]|nr:tetratricopeptide repeat protein [bacterium]